MPTAGKPQGFITASAVKERPSVPLPPGPALVNERDNFVIRKLATATLGSLEIDAHARVLPTGGIQPSPAEMTELRFALIKVYLHAANVRREAKPARKQIAAADAATRSLFRAAEYLNQAKPLNRRGLADAFGAPLDDIKGISELNAFVEVCEQARHKVQSIALDLAKAINASNAKKAVRGERKKRLRTLVEALSIWWVAATGKAIAPYVQAKRLGRGRKAFMLGRTGPFVELAVAVFVGVDEFKKSEVIAAVTNVHEGELNSDKARQIRRGRRHTI